MNYTKTSLQLIHTRYVFQIYFGQVLKLLKGTEKLVSTVNRASPSCNHPYHCLRLCHPVSSIILHFQTSAPFDRYKRIGQRFSLASIAGHIFTGES